MVNWRVWLRLCPCSLASFGVVAAAIVAALPERPSRAFEQPARGEAENAAAQRAYHGAESCRACHEEPREPYVTRSIDFIQLNEYSTWKHLDKHAQAFCVLRGELGTRMGDLMDLGPLPQIVNGELPESKWNACLNCHAMKFQERSSDPGFRLEDGIGCDGCHGPAEKWYTDHQYPEIWRRKLSVKEKDDKGMFDVRDPVKRTEMCLSCHVGNAKDGKVVTHAMYAAGHPPLPPMEVASFSEQLPRHWTYYKPIDVMNELKLDQHQMRQTRLAVIGAAVGLREQMLLLAAQSAKDPWPEYAQFDCAACHHELRRPSWRQGTVRRGVVGRPRAARWPLPLVELGAELAGRNVKELHAALHKLDTAASSRPFGDRRQIADAATQAANWTDGLVSELSSVKFDRSAAEGMLSRLSDIGAKGTHDFDSARQIAWALHTLYFDLNPGDDILRRIDEKAPAEVREAIKAVNSPTRDPQVVMALNELAAQLSLNLPERPAQNAKLKRVAGDGRNPDENGNQTSCSMQEQTGYIAAAMDQVFQASNGHNPELFKERMRNLVELIGKKK